jgi:hypothetical protein
MVRRKRRTRMRMRTRIRCVHPQPPTLSLNEFWSAINCSWYLVFLKKKKKEKERKKERNSPIPDPTLYLTTTVWGQCSAMARDPSFMYPPQKGSSNNIDVVTAGISMFSSPSMTNCLSSATKHL